MNRRQPLGEIENADKTWKTILSRFPHFEDLVPNASQLGLSLASKAEKLDNFIFYLPQKSYLNFIFV